MMQILTIFAAALFADPKSGGVCTGTFNWVNSEKGYGMITRDDGREDVFVHYSVLTERIENGDKVSFTWITTSKGDQVTSVVKSIGNVKVNLEAKRKKRGALV